MAQPLISICIPAYKKPQYVVRCLQSVLQQSYKQVEIVISDDSPDEDIKLAIEPLTNQLRIRYFHNQPALKSPRNWNAALDRAEGELIVLMHQDDWYHSPTALEEYVKVFEQNPEVDFVFCQNTAIDEKGNKTILQARPYLLKEMAEKPNHLLLAQVIGPPSNTMLRRKVTTRYDERFIWLVDVDYYSRMLKEGYKYQYIDKHLVSIGLHEDQTTVFCRTNDDIIFKENIWFAGKLEQKAFKDVLIYDYYWRLLRNYGIRDVEDIKRNGVKEEEIPAVILQMLQLQKKLPKGFLKNGILSKTFMSIGYSNWQMKKTAQ
jgi:glycosyltransferase involved in cell wall biosynthesis